MGGSANQYLRYAQGRRATRGEGVVGTYGGFRRRWRHISGQCWIIYCGRPGEGDSARGTCISG